MDRSFAAAGLFLAIGAGALAGCHTNHALAPEARIHDNNGTSATPSLVNPAVTSTGGSSEGTGNGENAPGTSMPSGAGIKSGPLDKDNAAIAR